MYPTYVSNAGLSMLEIRNRNEMWRSEDNGANWTLRETLSDEEKFGDGTYGQWSFGPFFHDSARDALIQFIRHTRYRCPPSKVTDYHSHVKNFIQHSPINHYRVSRDGGLTWDKRRQLIEDGDEYDENYYAKGYRHGEDSLIIGEVPPYLTLDNGLLALPFQGRSRMGADRFGSIQAGRLFGKWDDEINDYRWTSGGRVPGGGCEQTIARLKDGRILNILRTQGNIEPYYFDLWLRPYSVSEDNGETWSKPKPLQWDDGGGLTSPRAWSQLIRASDEKLYWIANILPDLSDISEIKKAWPGRADPRYPLVIVEVDEENKTLKRDTARVIADRWKDDERRLRFSNFHCYNDRETGEIVMLMQKSYHEDQPNLDDMPHPAWRFRVKTTHCRTIRAEASR